MSGLAAFTNQICIPWPPTLLYLVSLLRVGFLTATQGFLCPVLSQESRELGNLWSPRNISVAHTETRGLILADWDFWEIFILLQSFIGDRETDR